MTRRLLRPFVLVATAILLLAYAYMAWRLAGRSAERLALAVPFFLVWFVPVYYWSSDREHAGLFARLVHQASYLSMAWLSFALVLTLVRDALLPLADMGVPAVVGGSFLALAAGTLAAYRGPKLVRVDVPIEGLHEDLEGFRIVQISDLHVGLGFNARHVRRVVALAQSLAPDIVALTGDMVDGPVHRLAADIEPLRALAQEGRAFFVLGNHDCYSGARAWSAHFRSLGISVLLNEHAVIAKGTARVVVGGVLDPAVAMSEPGTGPRPDLALKGAGAAALRVLLAHNPKVAPLAERAGFELQISGHTHAGQFFPWTIAVRLVHAPHVAGLSREGRMWVYVSAGTGSWGPPVRLGTTLELTLIRLVRA